MPASCFVSFVGFPTHCRCSIPVFYHQKAGWTSPKRTVLPWLLRQRRQPMKQERRQWPFGATKTPAQSSWNLSISTQTPPRKMT